MSDPPAKVVLLEKPGLFVVTSHRVEIGKVDIELGRSLPVICLCPDPRDAAFGWDPGQFSGWDALIIGTREHIPDVQQQYGQYSEPSNRWTKWLSVAAAGQR